VFATKYRIRSLTPTIRAKLYPYLVGTGRALGIQVLAVNGVEDHLHLLISLPSNISLSEAVKKLKANSSRWLKEEFGQEKFAWQTGYSAFSVGLGAFEPTRHYIESQVEHHKRRDFKTEMAHMLEQHGMDISALSWFEVTT
jgi:putative transposase